MRTTFGVLVLVLLLSLLSNVHAFPGVGNPSCPILLQKETDLDCPWAAIARSLEQVPASKVESHLNTIAPDFLKRLDLEAKHTEAMKQLWGQSINFDEGAKSIIVPDAIIDVILKRAGVRPRHSDKIVHAGFEHTYGYLLSNLKTPYGYKRLRWVRPDIENGFALPKGTIAPYPEKGGLFANITYFAGRIVFRDETVQAQAARKILGETMGVSDDLKSFDFKTLHGKRLVETLKLPSGRTVEIRSDFVPFTVAAGESTGGNAELLIYSVYDSNLKLPYLVTAFPIGKGFSDGATNPSGLGEAQKIATRYNAWISGVTDSKVPLTGTRSVTTF